MLTMRKVSLVLLLDTSRQRKDGTATIKLRIVFNRFPKSYSTGISLSSDDYLKMCGRRPNKELSKIKRVCFEQLKKAYDIILGMRKFSFESFEMKFKSLRKANDMISYFDDYINQLHLEKRHGTAESYSCARNKLIQFAKNKKNGVSFDVVTVAFLKRLENYMISNGCSPTTVGIYCRCYRKLFNDAIRIGDIDKESYPFGSSKHGLYSPPQPRNIKKALSASDIKKIIDYIPVDGSAAHKYRDYFLFSYLGNGLNVKDICLLQYKHVHGDSIQFIRAKTANTNRNSKPISIALIDMNRAIISRWGNPNTSPETYIFPILDGSESSVKQRDKIKSFNKYLNKHLKKLTSKLGIEVHVTSYAARHSFATVLKRSGTNLAYISEAMGHSSLSTTESYLDSFESETRKENALKLIDL